MVMASCSNDEVLSTPDKQAIGFESYVGKTTRATDASMANLTKIYVYGHIGTGAAAIKNFDGTLVSRASATATDWTYDPVQYWTAGKDYFFTAVASSVESEGNHQYTYTWADALPESTAGYYGSGTIAFNNQVAAGNEDVIYAFAQKTTPDPMTASPGTVEFSFKHALSRVKFTFTNGMGSEAYSIKVYDLTINNAYASGNLVLGAESPVWSDQNATTTLTLRNNLYTPTNQIAANTMNVASGTKFIIPGAADVELKISFKVDLMVNGSLLDTYAHNNVVLPATAFQNGHSYNFKAEINKENIDPENDMYPIVFNVVEVEEWEESDVPVTLPE